MINGIHALIYAKDAAKAREFFRDVLKFRTVDVGHGWLIFALPPAELGIHPAEVEEYHELYLMCDNMKSTLAELDRRGVEYTPVIEVAWGILTSVTIPGGGTLGLYQPKHPTAISASTGTRAKKKEKATPRRLTPKRKTVNKKPRSRRKR